MTRRSAVDACTNTVGLGSVRKGYTMLRLLAQIRDQNIAHIIPKDKIRALAQAFSLPTTNTNNATKVIKACIATLEPKTNKPQSTTKTQHQSYQLPQSSQIHTSSAPIRRDSVLHTVFFNADHSNRYQRNSVIARGLRPTAANADFVGICEYGNRRDTLARKWLGDDFTYFVSKQKFCIAVRTASLKALEVWFPHHEHLYGIRVRHRETALEFVLVVTHFNNASTSQPPKSVIQSLAQLPALPTLFAGDFNRTPTELATLTSPPHDFSMGRKGMVDLHCNRLGDQVITKSIDNALYRNLPASNHACLIDTESSVFFEHPALRIAVPLGLRRHPITPPPVFDPKFVTKILRYAQTQVENDACYPFDDPKTFYVGSVREIYKVLRQNEKYVQTYPATTLASQMRKDIVAFMSSHPNAISPVIMTGLWRIRYPPILARSKSARKKINAKT